MHTLSSESRKHNRSSAENEMKEEKKTMQVTEYTCEYCYVKSLSKRKMERHEKRCASRPFQFTPYQWGEREVDDFAIGKHAERLLMDALRDAPKDEWSEEGSGPEVEWNYREDGSLPYDAYLIMRAKQVETVMDIIKRPEFMNLVKNRAEEIRIKAIQLVAAYIKKVKFEIPKEMEEKQGDSLDEREE
jgi:hypothetical protein